MSADIQTLQAMLAGQSGKIINYRNGDNGSDSNGAHIERAVIELVAPVAFAMYLVQYIRNVPQVSYSFVDFRGVNHSNLHELQKVKLDKDGVSLPREVGDPLSVILQDYNDKKVIGMSFDRAGGLNIFGGGLYYYLSSKSEAVPIHYFQDVTEELKELGKGFAQVAIISNNKDITIDKLMIAVSEGVRSFGKVHRPDKKLSEKFNKTEKFANKKTFGYIDEVQPTPMEISAPYFEQDRVPLPPKYRYAALRDLPKGQNAVPGYEGADQIPLPQGSDDDLSEDYVYPEDVPLPDTSDDDLTNSPKKRWHFAMNRSYKRKPIFGRSNASAINPANIPLPDTSDDDLSEDPANIPLPDTSDDDLMNDPNVRPSLKEKWRNLSRKARAFGRRSVNPANIPLPNTSDDDLEDNYGESKAQTAENAASIIVEATPAQVEKVLDNANVAPNVLQVVLHTLKSPEQVADVLQQPATSNEVAQVKEVLKTIELDVTKNPQSESAVQVISQTAVNAPEALKADIIAKVEQVTPPGSNAAQSVAQIVQSPQLIANVIASVPVTKEEAVVKKAVENIVSAASADKSLPTWQSNPRAWSGPDRPYKRRYKSRRKSSRKYKKKSSKRRRSSRRRRSSSRRRSRLYVKGTAMNRRSYTKHRRVSSRKRSAARRRNY